MEPRYRFALVEYLFVHSFPAWHSIWSFTCPNPRETDAACRMPGSARTRPNVGTWIMSLRSPPPDFRNTVRWHRHAGIGPRIMPA